MMESRWDSLPTDNSRQRWALRIFGGRGIYGFAGWTECGGTFGVKRFIKFQIATPMMRAKMRRTRKKISSSFFLRLMVAMTGAPHLGQVRAWSLIGALHS
jgi:hypothetical protein